MGTVTGMMGGFHGLMRRPAGDRDGPAGAESTNCRKQVDPENVQRRETISMSKYTAEYWLGTETSANMSPFKSRYGSHLS